MAEIGVSVLKSWNYVRQAQSSHVERFLDLDCGSQENEIECKRQCFKKNVCSCEDKDGY